MSNFNREEYDSWVVQRKPIPDNDKYYEQHDWTTVKRGLSYEEAYRRYKNKKGGMNKGHYEFRVHPEEEE